MDHFRITPPTIEFTDPTRQFGYAVLFFDMQGSSLRAEDLVFLDRHAPGAMWRKLDPTQINWVSRDSGTVGIRLSRGNIYQCIVLSKSFELEGRSEFEPDYDTHVYVHFRGEVTTIDKARKLTLNPGDPMVLDRATYVSLFAGIPGGAYRVDFWLLEDEAQLDTDGYINPSWVTPASAIGGGALHTSVADGVGTFTILGRYPGKKYHSLLLYRDDKGAYRYVKDFDWNGAPLTLNRYQRRLECYIERLFTTDCGDPSGDSTVKGEIILTESPGTGQNQTIWRTSLTGDEIDTFTGQEIPLTNGNLNEVMAFDRVIELNKDWWVTVSGSLTDIDGALEGDEPAVLLDENGRFDSAIETRIGEEEEEAVRKLFRLSPILVGDDASFEVTIIAKPRYRAL